MHHVLMNELFPFSSLISTLMCVVGCWLLALNLPRRYRLYRAYRARSGLGTYLPTYRESTLIFCEILRFPASFSFVFAFDAAAALNLFK